MLGQARSRPDIEEAPSDSLRARSHRVDTSALRSQTHNNENANANIAMPIIRIRISRSFLLILLISRKQAYPPHWLDGRSSGLI